MGNNASQRQVQGGRGASSPKLSILQRGGKALKSLDVQLRQQVSGGVDQLKGKLAFYPPPSTYAFQNDQATGALQMFFVFEQEREESPEGDGESSNRRVLAAAPGFSVFWLKRSSDHGGDKIPGMIFEVRQPRFTILFSHSNATDMGHMHELCRRLAVVLNVNVMAYEYTGYGCCQDKARPSEPATYADVRAALAFLVNTKAIPMHKIVLYGQSIGSGPTIDLAADEGGLAGVVVHSGLTSGLRVIQPQSQLQQTSMFDIFPNIDKIGSVRSPVLFIHGVGDSEVPIEHGIELHRGCPNPVTPLWIDGCGHNDIEFVGRKQYIEKLEAFLQHLEGSKS